MTENMDYSRNLGVILDHFITSYQDAFETRYRHAGFRIAIFIHPFLQFCKRCHFVLVWIVVDLPHLVTCPVSVQSTYSPIQSASTLEFVSIYASTCLVGTCNRVPSRNGEHGNNLLPNQAFDNDYIVEPIYLAVENSSCMFDSLRLTLPNHWHKSVRINH